MGAAKDPTTVGVVVALLVVVGYMFFKPLIEIIKARLTPNTATPAAGDGVLVQIAAGITEALKHVQSSEELRGQTTMIVMRLDQIASDLARALPSVAAVPQIQKDVDRNRAEFERHRDVDFADLKRKHEVLAGEAREHIARDGGGH